jgi:ATP dependent DNA ligase C terminal region
VNIDGPGRGFVEGGQEFVVGGFTDPAGSRTDFGALLVGYYKQGRLWYAGKVGIGYRAATLRELGARLRELERPESPFVDVRPIPRGTHWTAPPRAARRQAPNRGRPRAARLSAGRGPGHAGGLAGVDRWAAGREVLRASDPRMAALVDADPELDPEAWMDRVPSDLWGSLVLQVIGQQLSLAAAAAILARVEALHGGRLPTPAELLGTSAQALRQVDCPRQKVCTCTTLPRACGTAGSTSSGC